MLLIIKRILGQFLAPLPLIALIFLLGWTIRHATRGRRLGFLVQLLAGVLFLVVSLGLCERALYRLEQTYPPFDPTPARCQALRGSDIVVLGQGLDPESELPVRFRDNDAFRNRMIEAARIARRVPDSRLLVSMAGPATPADKAAALADYAALFNIAPGRMLLIPDGVDTESEARLALRRARSGSIIVVTSASHLPRAIPLFQRAANLSTNAPAPFRLTPAPADYVVRKPVPSLSWTRLPLPSARFCLNADRLFHETWGRIFERLRARFHPPPN